MKAAATTGTSRLLAAAAVLTIAWHLASSPQTLEDIDSVNFALGVERFDVAAHRPHPPGYPVYIAAGKLSHAVVSTLTPTWSRDRRAAVSLAWWSALAVGLAVPAIAAFWRAIGLAPMQAALAAILAVVSPLFWLTGSRPLTDAPGLVLAIAIQAALIRGLRESRESETPIWPRVWWWAAFGAGVCVGVRTQTMWLTGPLLCWCAGVMAGQHRWREAAQLLGMAAVGVLVWFVPMVVLTGGPSAYLAALGSQGAEDFIGVEMLATMPSWSLLTEGLSRTLRTPWLDPTLATVVLTLAAAGVVHLAWRGQRVLALVLLAFWPYGVFHITFQETETIRYALPLVVPVAGLVVLACWLLPRRVGGAALAAVLSAAVWFAQPPLRAYSENGAPIFRAIADIEASAGLNGADAPTAVAMHRRVATESVQARVWAAEEWPFEFLPSEFGAEVSATIDYWRRGATSPVWFLANPARRDLRQIDHRARTQHAAYRWHPDTGTLVAVARPTDIDTWIFRRPRWMLGHGWAVTPEVGGVTAALQLGPHRAPAVGYLRRDAEPLRVVIGGRHLGAPTDPAVTIVVRLDGQELDRWVVTPQRRDFMQWIELPTGVPAGDTPYATMSVTAEAVGSEARPPVGLEFFDAATAADVVWAYGDGWFEPEQETGGALLWRWMSRRATVRVEAPEGPLVLRVRGAAHVGQLGRPAELKIRLGQVEVARRVLNGDFDERITLPADVRAAAGGVISFDVDVDFSPSDRGQSADQRRLSLRIFGLSIEPDAR